MLAAVSEELFTLDVVQNDRYAKLGILRILPGLHPTVEFNPVKSVKYHAATILRVTLAILTGMFSVNRQRVRKPIHRVAQFPRKASGISQLRADHWP